MLLECPLSRSLYKAQSKCSTRTRIDQHDPMTNKYHGNQNGIGIIEFDGENADLVFLRVDKPKS